MVMAVTSDQEAWVKIKSPASATDQNWICPNVSNRGPNIKSRFHLSV